MRALLVGAAPVSGSASLLTTLTAEVDVVIAVDGGGSLCLEAGVVPGIVVGDFDSLPPADEDRLRELGSVLRRFPAEKDASDLELAVAEARTLGATSVVVTAAASGRLDHTMTAIAVLAAASDLQTRLVEPSLQVWVLSPEGARSLTLLGSGATISLLAFGGDAVVSASGVVWGLEEAALSPTSSLGLSNRIGAGGTAHVCVSEGVVLVFAPRVEGSPCAQGR